MNDLVAIPDAEAPKVHNRRLEKFGPNLRLSAFETEATAPSTGIGAVLWGMGIAHLRVARQLARLGIPSLHVAVSAQDPSKEHYSQMGIELVQSAMERLAANRRIDSFVVMANCAFANISFNTAVVDPRIRMLALTNPYLSRTQIRETRRWSLLDKALDPNKWKRFFQGKVKLGRNLDSAFIMITGRSRTGLPGEVGKTEPSGPRLGIGKDMLLPRDFDVKLRALCERGVEVYYGCSTSEFGLLYMQGHYRRTLNDLQREGKLTLTTIDTDVHLIRVSTEGALMHCDAICAWLSRSANLPKP